MKFPNYTMLSDLYERIKQQKRLLKIGDKVKFIQCDLNTDKFLVDEMKQVYKIIEIYTDVLDIKSANYKFQGLNIGRFYKISDSEQLEFDFEVDK